MFYDGEQITSVFFSRQQEEKYCTPHVFLQPAFSKDYMWYSDKLVLLSQKLIPGLCSNHPKPYFQSFLQAGCKTLSTQIQIRALLHTSRAEGKQGVRFEVVLHNREHVSEMTSILHTQHFWEVTEARSNPDTSLMDFFMFCPPHLKDAKLFCWQCDIFHLLLVTNGETKLVIDILWGPCMAMYQLAKQWAFD